MQMIVVLLFIVLMIVVLLFIVLMIVVLLVTVLMTAGAVVHGDDHNGAGQRSSGVAERDDAKLSNYIQ